jgi:hypothetical protein
MRLGSIVVLVAALAFLGLSSKKARDKATSPLKKIVTPAHRVTDPRLVRDLGEQDTRFARVFSGRAPSWRAAHAVPSELRPQSGSALLS